MASTLRDINTVNARRVDRDKARRERRREREQAIISKTRALFDERGTRDAPIDEIARAAGINKALIYRAFDSQEEIFVLVVTDYLAELEVRTERGGAHKDPEAELRRCLGAYADFCLQYPAFLDCALSLMQQPAAELRSRVSETIWLRLGRAMAVPLGHLECILAAGAERGVFAIEDPDFAANRIYAQILGSMHLARAQVGVREVAPGVAGTFTLDPERVRDACIGDALALVRIMPPAKGKTR